MTQTKKLSFLEHLAAVLFMVIFCVPILLFCACRFLYGKSLWRRALRYSIQGRYAEAEPLLRRGLAIVEQQIGSNHSTVDRGLVDHAAILRKLGREAEAAELDARRAAKWAGVAWANGAWIVSKSAHGNRKFVGR